MILGSVLPATIAGYGLAALAIGAGHGTVVALLTLLLAGNGVAAAIGTWQVLQAARPQNPDDFGPLAARA